MIRWIGRGLVGLLFLSAPVAAQLPPPKAEQALKIVPGLQIKSWASEPLFVNPTCMDVDHLGRVWVCESVNYRNKLRGRKNLVRPQGDRIVILEDEKGTGKATKATTFYQAPEILAPLGIAVAKNPTGPGYKVFICQSPDILVLEDADGDGKADGPPKKLLTNFGGIDHDHGVHGILIGPDMKLYFSVGDSGVQGLQSSDKKGRVWRSNGADCRAGTIWRCNLDGTNLQLIAHNFRNEYEPCVDSFGTVFVSDNDDDGNQQTRICYVMPGGNYGYHPRGSGQTHWHEEQPGVVPKILRTYFGSPTGMCVYEGKLLPRKYHGQLLHTDAGPNHVRCYHLTPEGASYAVNREDMVTTLDKFFRPSDVCVAPDGSVFVADWYDQGVGGHNVVNLEDGRIYRISPSGEKATNPKVDLSTDQGRLAALGSPALSVRYMAMARIAALDRDAAVKLLTPAATQKDDAVLRARALWQLARAVGASGIKCAPLDNLLADSDSRFQILGIRLRKDFLGKADSLADDLIRLAQAKADTAVLREGLLALRDLSPVTAKPAIYELMKHYDGKDRFYLAAVGIAVGHLDAVRREILLKDFDRQLNTWDERTANLVWELRPPNLLGLLGGKLTDSKLTAAQRVQIVDTLAGSSDKGVGEALIKVLTAEVPSEVRERIANVLKNNLPDKWASVRKSPQLKAALDTLLERAGTQSTALELIAAAERADFAPRVVELATKKEIADALRKTAIQTLGRLSGRESVETLATLLRTGPGISKPEAAAALGDVQKSGNSEDALKARSTLQEAIQGKSYEIVVREAAVLGLSSGAEGSRWLLRTHKEGKLPAELIPRAGQVLRSSSFRDIQREAAMAFPPAGKLNPAKLPPIAVLARQKGDPLRGQQLLNASLKSNLQCLKCHMVRGNGGQVGPDLSMIGKKATKENLLESILYPSKAVADQYVTWVIETRRGLAVQGLLVEETATHVTLRDAEGRDTKVAKSSIEKREKSPKSLMPEDLIVTLSQQDLVDLAEHLLTLKTASLTPTSWHIAGPFDNGGGMVGLDTVFPPEKEVDLKATYQGKHGKVTWRTVRPGAGGYIDLQAFFAGKSDDTVSYLTQELTSPVDQEATLLIGSDDGARVWVNDKVVLTSRVTRAAAAEQNTVKVQLKKGTNRILFKINNGNGGHGLYFTVLSEQELKQGK